MKLAAIPFGFAVRGQHCVARTLHELAEALTNRGVPTLAGKGTWRPEQVRRIVTAFSNHAGKAAE